MQVNAKRIEQVLVEVEPKEVVDALIKHYGFDRAESCLFTTLIYSEDISYHGSPTYEYYGKEVGLLGSDLFETLKHLQWLLQQDPEMQQEGIWNFSKGFTKLSDSEFEELYKLEQGAKAAGDKK